MNERKGGERELKREVPCAGRKSCVATSLVSGVAACLLRPAFRHARLTAPALLQGQDQTLANEPRVIVMLLAAASSAGSWGLGGICLRACIFEATPVGRVWFVICGFAAWLSVWLRGERWS